VKVDLYDSGCGWVADLAYSKFQMKLKKPVTFCPMIGIKAAGSVT
jgi:hypothetical protein